MNSEKPHFYEFGPFRLDPFAPFLWREGQPASLTPKALETLVVLVRHCGHVVSREELIEAVWPNVAVEENNLSVNISFLRKALGETPEGKNHIETVPRRGYRFVVPVRIVPIESLEITYSKQTSSTVLVEETSETDAVLDIKPVATTAQATVTPVSSNSRLQKLARWPVFVAIVIIVAALVTGASFLKNRWQQERTAVAVGDDRTQIRSLAVLPLKPITTDNRDALSLGLADCLITRLGSSQNIIVRPLSSVTKYAATEYDALKVGRALQVD